LIILAQNMADTAHTDPDMMVEHKDTEDVVESKAAEVAQWIKQAKHFIIFTGAGISTSAGIPDFRGPEGVWTLRAQGKARTSPSTSSIKAIPTPSHMSIVSLFQSGYLKFLISQNTDGLHRKSGVNPNLLAELHGNSNIEKCDKCGKQYLRDYRVRNANKVSDHLTGRKCSKPKCGGNLHDSIINFGENLPTRDLDLGFSNAEKADLCLVLGSSLTVTPAADMPKLVGKKAKLVIVNLQKTPLDKYAKHKVHTTADDFMRLVMRNLELEIPEWRLNRRIVIQNIISTSKQEIWKWKLHGVDVDNTPVSFVKQADITCEKEVYSLTNEPFLLTETSIKRKTSNDMNFLIKLEFMGHYAEPELQLEYRFDTKVPQRKKLLLCYNPFQRQWKVSEEAEDNGLSMEELTILINA